MRRRSISLDSSHHGLCDGAIFFTVKNKPGLAYGATIANRAGIYFDDNPVVMTNTANVTKGCPGPLDVHAVNNAHRIEIYPNPAHNTLTITSTDNITNVVITNIIGQTVYTNNYNTQQAQINIADLPAGVYFVKVNNTDVRKFVKE